MKEAKKYFKTLVTGDHISSQTRFQKKKRLQLTGNNTANKLRRTFSPIPLLPNYYMFI